MRWGMGGGHTPILGVTGQALKEEAERSIAAGCDAHLTKPIRKTDLIDAINHWAKTEQKASVTIDSWLEDIVPGYLQKRRKDVGVLKEALANSDLPTLRTLGHQMMGTGGGYGLPVITELGGRIERGALDKDVEGLKKAVADLDRYLDEVRVQYR